MQPVVVNKLKKARCDGGKKAEKEKVEGPPAEGCLSRRIVVQCKTVTVNRRRCSRGGKRTKQ